ncbi:uncharacterized protein LOC123499296 [Portunus trituberculatus]|uniref:uncharacterized protein LOC123499296 n=1 Tax=Portunus trituberculatus TaxID=210409 RepID=UPI001E1CCB4D|nr:uncharacterized protein LOC123499296 [Portunus trituberculatus]
MAAACAAWCLVVMQVLMVDYAAASRSGSSAAHLQQDGVARADSGLTWRHTLPSLTTYTFCVRLFSFRSRYVDYMFSYATEGYDNELAFHLKYSQGELRMACCSRRVFHIERVEVTLLSWFSFCVAVNLSTYGAFFVFRDTVKNVTLFDSLQNSSRPLEVVGGGTVMVGQDQDEQLGGTDKDQSFNGFIVDMILTQTLLTVRDMTDYISCNMDGLRTFSYILDFENITEDFILGAETIVEEVGDVCRSERNKRLSVFPEARTNAEANHFCSTLNGYIVTPLSAEENMFLFNEGSQFRDKCREFDKKNAMWVGVFWDPSARLWKNHITSEEAKFKNFEVEIMPSSHERLCVSAATVSESTNTALHGAWDIESCQKKICTACQFERSLPLKIRGLCAESHFDRSYFIYGTLNFRPVFNGARWSRIEWRDNSSWLLYQIGNPDIRALMMDSTDTGYPVGVHDYEVIGDNCPEKVQRLKLTSCRGNTFTCGDGECIDISRRCNLELDCDDHSDELNCDTLIIQPGYEKRLPPPKTDSDTPAGVTIDCDIMLIRKLDLLSAQLILDVAIKRTWYDSRIHFKNLHPDHNLNQISDPMEIVWYPDLSVVGSDNSHVVSTFYITKAWGQRSSRPLPDDDTLIDEDVFYPGSSNPLVLHREFTTTLMCTFDLTLYPFDTQSCPMILIVADYTFQYVSTSLQNVTFSGTRRLLEYRTLESMIAKRITTYLDEHRLLNNRQFGFRSNRSTNDILLNLSTALHQPLDRGKDSFVIALDIAGAFDRVWHSGLATKLRSMGVCGSLLHLLQDYLQDRSLCVVVNRQSSQDHPISDSVSQGSVLGPLLWNVFFNDLLQLIPEAHAYAEDCTLTFPCDSTDHRATVALINQALETITSWSLLDKVQDRARRLISTKALPDEQAPLLQPLQHKRDVAGLCATYKIHKEGAPHLSALRQPWAAPHPHSTREACTENHLTVPFARTETFLRSFVPRYTRLWNNLVSDTDIHKAPTLQKFNYLSISFNITFPHQVTSVIHRSFLHENKSGQHIEIVMTNLYGYYISGAYVPTMLLVIISYLTFFFDLSDFTNRIMVSLTSLLVLASLFSQIASGLPKTAYMKLIDVWFIFCILADFVMVFVLVVINSSMLKKEESSPPSFHRVLPFSSATVTSSTSYPSALEPRSRLFHKLPFKEQRTGWRAAAMDPQRCNTVAQVFLPILLSLFVVIYFGSVAYYMDRVEAEFGV